MKKISIRVNAEVEGEITAGHERAGVLYVRFPSWVSNVLIRGDYYPIGSGRFVYKTGGNAPEVGYWIAEFEELVIA